MDAGNALTARVELPTGSWVVVKAYDANNNESDPSNEIGPVNLAPRVGCLTNQTICAGQPFLFSLDVTNAEAVTYQWQLNGTNIAGATNACYTVASATVANAGAYTVTLTGANGAASRTASLMVDKAPVTVTFSNLVQTYDGMGKSVRIVTSVNNLAVSCTYKDSADAPTNAGSYMVIGTVNDANYVGRATNTLVIVPASQTIAFASIADQARTNTVNLSATASSGLPVEFAVLSGPAQMAGSQLVFTAAGSVSIAAAQAGDFNYLAAVSVTNTFTVTNIGSAVLALGNNEVNYAWIWNSTNLPPAQTLTVSNAGELALTFTNIVTYSAGASNWLAVAPDNGALPAGSSLVLTGAVTVTNLIPGTYYATNALLSLEATNSPQVWVTQLIVSKASQTITFPVIAAQVVTNVVTLNASASSELPVNYEIVSGLAQLSGSQLTFTGQGSVRVVVSQEGNAWYEAVESVTNTFNVVAAVQASLVFLPVTPQAFNTTNGLSVTGGTGTGAVSYAVLSGPGVIVEENKLWVTNGTGTVELVATKAADALYSSLSITTSVVAAKAEQNITFPPLADQARTNTVNLSATASSGLPVEFAVLSGPAQMAGSQLTFTAADNVSVVATQVGDSNYLTAVSVTNTFTVTNIGSAVLALGNNEVNYAWIWNSTNLPPAQTLTVSNAGELALTFSNIVTYSAGASNWLAVAPDNGALPAGSSLVLTGAVTVTNLVPGTYYATNVLVSPEATNSPQVWVAQMTVNKAAQTITFPPIAAQVTTNTLTLAATIDSSLPVTFSVVRGLASLSGSTNLTLTGVGVVSIVCSQAGDGNYLAADSVTNTFNVVAAEQAPLVFVPASLQNFNATNLLSATGGSGTGAVSYAVLSGPGLLLEAGKLWVTNGTGMVELVATKAADALYNALSVTSTVVAAKAQQTITFPPLVGQARTNTITLGATATSELTVVYDLLSGPAQLVGSQLTFTEAGTVNLAARQAGDSNYLAATSVTNTFAVTNTGSAVLVLDTNAMTYAYTWNSTNLPPAQTLTVSNAGELALTFTNIVTYSAGASNWLAITLDNGALSSGSSLVLTGAVTVTNLIPGTYYATNALVSPEATNSPQVWVAQLTVNKAPHTITIVPLTVNVPSNGVPVLKILQGEPVRGTNYEVTGHIWHWQGTPGRRYDIEAITQLNGGQWTGVRGGTNLPGAETMTWTNYFYERTNQYEFFRIRARVE
jgi:hypothetical protein